MVIFRKGFIEWTLNILVCFFCVCARKIHIFTQMRMSSLLLQATMNGCHFLWCQQVTLKILICVTHVLCWGVKENVILFQWAHLKTSKQCFFQLWTQKTPFAFNYLWLINTGIGSSKQGHCNNFHYVNLIHFLVHLPQIFVTTKG